jgi:hypothetical protein
MTTLDELEKLLAEHERLHDDLANHAEGSFEQVAAADRCHAIRYEFQSALLANSVELIASARRVRELEKALRIADSAIDAVIEFDGVPQYCGEKVDAAYYAISAALKGT